MRGPGEFLGTQQSGFPAMLMADFTDMRLLHEVREVAEALLARDPDLDLPEHAMLQEKVSGFWQGRSDLS